MVNTPGLQDDIENSCDKTFQNDDLSEAVKEDNRNEDEALVVLFADSLMPSLDRHEEKGKKLYKWNGSLENLKSFVELISHRKGSWKGLAKTGKQTFSENNSKIHIYWWSTSKTLGIQGPSDTVEDIEGKLDNLLEKYHSLNQSNQQQPQDCEDFGSSGHHLKRKLPNESDPK